MAVIDIPAPAMRHGGTMRCNPDKLDSLKKGIRNRLRHTAQNPSLLNERNRTALQGLGLEWSAWPLFRRIHSCVRVLTGQSDSLAFAYAPIHKIRVTPAELNRIIKKELE